MRNTKQKLAVARGDVPADLVLTNGKIMNVLSAEIHEGDIAITDGRIVGIGKYDGKEIADLEGKFVSPSFIDGHIHIESSMLTVHEFARAVVPHGTGAVVIDPHEYANVLGLVGIDYVLSAAEHVPMEVFVMMSSCVPATHLESAGARLGAEEIAAYIDKKRIAGVAELMNFPGVFLGWDSELEKIEAGKHKVIDGHSPKLSGKNLNAYILAGVRSDHECTSREEAEEKLRRGIHILLREGTAERNLHDLLPLVHDANAVNFSFATDDKHPASLMDEGHIDHHIREAIAFGINPIVAIQMATINTARHFRLKNLGAIAPRCWADLVTFSDLNALHIEDVYKRGKKVASGGQYLCDVTNGASLDALRHTMKVGNFDKRKLRVPAQAGKIKVIELVPRQIVTKQIEEIPKIENGELFADTSRDMLKLVVIERHRATGNVGVGFVRGFGLKSGALGSTVAHDAHNIIIVGTNDDDIILAAQTLIDMEGGLCVTNDGSVVGKFALPLAGLVSDQPLEIVREKVDDLCAAAAQLGSKVADPFMTLSFLALSPIPELKVTDLGLVDATKFEVTELFV